MKVFVFENGSRGEIENVSVIDVVNWEWVKGVYNERLVDFIDDMEEDGCSREECVELFEEDNVLGEDVVYLNNDGECWEEYRIINEGNEKCIMKMLEVWENIENGGVDYYDGVNEIREIYGECF